MRWNIKVWDWENIPPYGTIPVRINDRARVVGVGDSGEEIYFLKKSKKYRIGYGKKLGKNLLAWAKSKDGWMYNVSFGDLDKKLLEVGIIPTNKNMRYASSVLRKSVEKRFDDRTFIEKWGVPITIGMLVIAICAQAGGSWLSIRESNKGKDANVQIAKAQQETMELARQVLSSVENIKSGGTGLTPAP